MRLSPNYHGLLGETILVRFSDLTTDATSPSYYAAIIINMAEIPGAVGNRFVLNK